jgi:PKD repeat protein
MKEYLINEEQKDAILLRTAQINKLSDEIDDILFELPEHEPEPILLPIANFTASPDNGTFPLTVTFINFSTNTDTYSWIFGDGGASDLKDPIHTYSSAGTFSVRLVVRNAQGTDSITKEIVVVAPEPSGIAPVADFSATPLSGLNAPLSVQFTNLTTGTEPITYKWDMSDGAGNLPENTQKNPAWRFWNKKKYTISLTATNAYGTSKRIRTDYITVGSVVPDPEPFPIPTDFGCGSSYLGNPIGGGAGYTDIKTGGTYTVTSLDSLKMYLSKAKAGDIIFIHPGVTINFNGSATVSIPSGVTLASDRGNNSTGAKLTKTQSTGGWKDAMLTTGGNNVRITGLVLEGEMLAESESPIISESLYLKGVTCFGHSGLEIDNCELRGWAYAAVFCDHCPTVGRPTIHHCYIHHNTACGEGYGCNVNYGDMLMEGNVLDWNRHSFTGGGQQGEKAEVRYNRHLGHGCAQGSAHWDVHEAEAGGAFAGEEYHIHHNTVDQCDCCATGKCSAVLHIRENPTVGVYYENNLINTDWGSGNNYRGWQKPHRQSLGGGSTVYKNVFCKNNSWRGVVYPDNSVLMWYS